MAWTIGALAVAAAAATYQGETQRRAQKTALGRQKAAQNEAAAFAAAEMRRAEQEQKRLSARKPDTAAILLEEQQRALAGQGSTSLTGPGGAPVRPKLGDTSLLGGTPS